MWAQASLSCACLVLNRLGFSFLGRSRRDFVDIDGLSPLDVIYLFGENTSGRRVPRQERDFAETPYMSLLLVVLYL